MSNDIINRVQNALPHIKNYSRRAFIYKSDCPYHLGHLKYNTDFCGCYFWNINSNGVNIVGRPSLHDIGQQCNNNCFNIYEWIDDISRQRHQFKKTLVVQYGLLMIRDKFRYSRNFALTIARDIQAPPLTVSVLCSIFGHWGSPGSKNLTSWKPRSCRCYTLPWLMLMWRHQAPGQQQYSISQEMCTRFCCALLCCGYAIVHNEFTWSIYPYSSGLLCWHCGNLTIAPVPVK